MLNTLQGVFTSSKWTWRHSDVIIAKFSFDFISRSNKDIEKRKTSSCSSRQCASNDMRHDPLCDPWVITWPWPEVKFPSWPFEVKSTPLDASRREEHDGVTNKSVSLLDQKLWGKNRSSILTPFRNLRGHRVSQIKNFGCHRRVHVGSSTLVFTACL